MQSFGGLNRSRKQMASDQYCWCCHKNQPNLSCTTCVRSFHISSMCLQSKEPPEIDTVNWRCPECIHLEKQTQTCKAMQINHDPDHLKKVLHFILKLILSKGSLRQAFMNIDYPRRRVANTMDLSTIGNKIEIGAYNCCEDFLADLKWIVHNSKAYCGENYDIVKSANVLNRFVKEELISIDLCYECYINLEHDWFELPCKVPHLLIWAKQRTFPYWPAKLMRFNQRDNTIDVRYFGDDHLRAVLPAKNCLLFSRQNPSFSIGSLKKALELAQKEAECYIGNLIKTFGSFNYAQPISPIYGNMLERHLYDMIPNAWHQLGKKEIPPPIQKPMPASAIRSRRMSVPARMIARETPKQIVTTGRIMTRRLSMILDGSFDPSTAAPKKVTDVRRQSIQFDNSMDLTNASSKAVTSSVQKISKTRRMSCNIEMSTSKATKKTSTILHADTLISSTTTSNGNLRDDSLFKVPAVPSPRRTPPKKPIKSNTATKNVVPTKMDKPSQSIGQAKKRTATEKLNGQTNQEPKNKRACLSRDSVHAADMIAMSNVVSERNSKQMVKVVQSSLANTLFDFLDTSNAENRFEELHDQLAKQQQSHNLIVDGLRAVNHDLKDKMTKYATELKEADEKQSKEYQSELINLKKKNEQMAQELKKAIERNDELNSKLGVMSAKNTFLSTNMKRMQNTNCELSKSLKNSEIKSTQLINMNRSLTEVNNKLMVNMDSMNLANQTLTEQLKEAENKNSQTKKDTLEYYAKMVTEAKKKQWCAHCLMPGGRYFCSSHCEKCFWNPGRGHTP